MYNHIKLINDYWKGKHVIVNEGQEDYTVGKIKDISIHIDNELYITGPKIKIIFDESCSDVPEKIYLIDSLQIKKDLRFEQ